jgi:hypothetical protein
VVKDAAKNRRELSWRSPTPQMFLPLRVGTEGIVVKRKESCVMVLLEELAEYIWKESTLHEVHGIQM